MVFRSTSPHWDTLEITAHSRPPRGSPPRLALFARPSSRARHGAKCVVNRRRTVELACWVGRAAVSRGGESVFRVTDPSAAGGAGCGVGGCSVSRLPGGGGIHECLSGDLTCACCSRSQPLQGTQGGLAGLPLPQVSEKVVSPLRRWEFSQALPGLSCSLLRLLVTRANRAVPGHVASF